MISTEYRMLDGAITRTTIFHHADYLPTYRPTKFPTTFVSTGPPVVTIITARVHETTGTTWTERFELSNVAATFYSFPMRPGFSIGHVHAYRNKHCVTPCRITFPTCPRIITRQQSVYKCDRNIQLSFLTIKIGRWYSSSFTNVPRKIRLDTTLILTGNALSLSLTVITFYPSRFFRAIIIVSTSLSIAFILVHYTRRVVGVAHQLNVCKIVYIIYVRFNI